LPPSIRVAFIFIFHSRAFDAVCRLILPTPRRYVETSCAARRARDAAARLFAAAALQARRVTARRCADDAQQACLI